jgi:hypothetical protein
MERYSSHDCVQGEERVLDGIVQVGRLDNSERKINLKCDIPLTRRWTARFSLPHSDQKGVNDEAHTHDPCPPPHTLGLAVFPPPQNCGSGHVPHGRI